MKPQHKNTIELLGQKLYIPKAQIRIRLPSFFESKLLHLVGLVEGQIVYRYFGKHKQWWHYGVIAERDLQFYLESEKDIKRWEYKVKRVGK